MISVFAPSRVILPLLFWLCISVVPGFAQQVSLNEIMASNNSTIADTNSDFSDWIEIHNHGNETVNLSGYGLSDDEDDPFQWVFPDITIQPGEFMLIWASNKNRIDPNSELHTNFAISASGEEVVLTHPDGNRIDMLTPTEIPTDISIGRKPNGTGDWLFFDEPTPGEANSTNPLGGILDKPQLSVEPGFYNAEFELQISHPEEGVAIYYTLDGSEPTTDSAELTGPIPIFDRNNDPNVFSTIPTNFIDNWRTWRKPFGPVPKGTVIRLLAVKNGYEPAQTTATYFISTENKNNHTLPVISIATDSLNFFSDETGIYVPGNSYVDGNDGSGNYYNRGINWERVASFEFFDEQGVRQIEQDVGVRIHGGHTRRFEQKTLRIYARNEYGESHINFPIFPDQDYSSYKRLLLRNSGNDQGQTMFRDAAAHQIVKHFNMDTQAYQPAAVYINGEYWGLHNIRERFDKHYLERVYGINPDKIDYLTNRWTIEEGDNQQYAALLTFIANNNLGNSSNYDYVKTRIDIDHYLDYLTAQVYFANTDWPHGNIDFWRTQNSYNPSAPKGHDGRWRWLFYDIDFTFGLVEEADYNMLSWITRRTAFQGREWPNLILRNLLENENFKHGFINRMADHLNSSFRTERVLGILEQIKETIRPEMEKFVKRWNFPRSIEQWDMFTNPAFRFARDRLHYLTENILNHFEIDSTSAITVDVAQPDWGNVRVNSLLLSEETPGIDPDPLPWTGIYFSGIPVTLVAEPVRAYQFSHWLVDGERVNGREITILPDQTENITAFFQGFQFDSVESHKLSDGYYFFYEWDKEQPSGTYPENMAFVFMNEADPGLSASVEGAANGAYNLSSRTRINGLGEDGFSFINTSNPDGNPGYPGTKLGGAILAIDTRNIEGAEVGWRAGTVEPNSRIYNLRLQYRTDPESTFIDLSDPDGNPVEYVRHTEAGHNRFIGPIPLPDDAIGYPEVELLWRYYYTGEREDEESGQRAELNISEIYVSETTPELRPEPFPLTDEGYTFTQFSTDPINSKPESMEFVYMNQADPGLDAQILGFTDGLFDLDSRTRVNGLGDGGIAFINTTSLDGNPGYPGRRLGGALLSLNTGGRGTVSVEWTGSTVEPNSRVYNLRLQYRISEEGDFKNVLDDEGKPVEYTRNELENHSLQIGPVTLPPKTDNQPLVQLFWRFYHTGETVSEENEIRTILRLDDIFVDSEPILSGNPGMPDEFIVYQNYPNPFYPFTTIRYDLPADQDVTVELFTISGRHISTIERGFKKAGRHSVQVDGTALASGIYLYRVRTDDYSETRKMSIIK